MLGLKDSVAIDDVGESDEDGITVGVIDFETIYPTPYGKVVEFDFGRSKAAGTLVWRECPIDELDPIRIPAIRAGNCARRQVLNVI